MSNDNNSVHEELRLITFIKTRLMLFCDRGTCREGGGRAINIMVMFQACDYIDLEGRLEGEEMQ